MSKRLDIAINLEGDAVADLDRLATEWGCTREHVATTALLRLLNEESRNWPTEFDSLPPFVESDPLAINLDEAERRAATALQAYLEPAEKDIKAGRLIDHDDFLREMRGRYRSRNAA